MGGLFGKKKKPTTTVLTPAYTGEGPMSIEQFMQTQTMSTSDYGYMESVGWNLNASGVTAGFRDSRKAEYDQYLTQYNAKQAEESVDREAEIIARVEEEKKKLEVAAPKPVNMPSQTDSDIYRARKRAIAKSMSRKGRASTILSPTGLRNFGGTQ